MNLSMKRKQTHRQKEQTCDCHGGGELGDWWSGRLRLADVSYCIHGADKQGPTL